ncbi:hypothetical protein LTR50_007667 [Elasticomyces elasticus]|nr:hypothetical protein LTR50_007667 [Elasticomyces elasticus]
MAPHSLWLAMLHGRTGSTLREYEHALEALPLRDANRSPSFVVLVGRRTKSEILRHFLRGADADCLPQNHGQAYLWYDRRSKHGENPTVYVDCELQTYDRSQCKGSNGRGPDTTRTMDWAVSSPRLFTRRKMGNLLCARVIAPLSAAVCYFASDLGGMRAVATLLAEQGVEKPPSDLPETVLPHVLVVVETASQDFDATVTESEFVESVVEIMRSLERYRREGDVRDALGLHFKQVRVIGLRRGTDVKSRATALRMRIVTVSKEASVARAACRLSLRLSHVQGLVGSLLDQFCRDHATPFSFVRASRPMGFTTQDFAAHLRELMDRVPLEISLWHLVAPLVASSMLLANYPPGAHLFPPGLVFQQLYRSVCKAAVYGRAVQPLVRKSLLAVIERDFESLFEELASASGEWAAAALHFRRLRSLHVYLRDLRSHKTCLSCLLRSPEVRLITLSEPFR